MLHHLIQYKAGKNAKPTVQSPKNAQGQEEKENPMEAQETPQEESKEPENSGIDQKIADLQVNHEKEIMMLKHELEVQGIKQGNDKKIADLEKVLGTP